MEIVTFLTILNAQDRVLRRVQKLRKRSMKMMYASFAFRGKLASLVKALGEYSSFGYTGIDVEGITRSFYYLYF